MEIKEIYLNKHCVEKKFQSNNTLAHTTYTPQRFYKQTLIQVRTRWTLINTQSTQMNPM